MVAGKADENSGAMSAQLLRGQKALVTGANSGIGEATAIALGRAGADVVVNYVVGADEAEKVCAQIEGFGVRAYAHEADVSNEDQVVAMVARMVEEFGTIDVLVANAGLQRDSAVTEMTLAQWQKVIDVNLTGQFLCAREAAKEFMRRGVVEEVSRSAGKIICMSSVHQIIPWSGHVNYASSKGGVGMLMQTLAQELAPPSDQGQRDCTRRHSHTDQSQRLVNPRGRGRPPAADSVPPRGRPGRHRQRRRRRVLGPARLRRRQHALRRRWDDALPRLRHRRLILCARPCDARRVVILGGFRRVVRRSHAAAVTGRGGRSAASAFSPRHSTWASDRSPH